jgi:hypothetical protein
MFLLGLHGPAQSGKDTAFAVIEKVAAEAGLKAARRGFADKLKQSAMRMFKPDATVEEAVAWADDFKFNGKVMTFTGFAEPHPEVEGSASEWIEEPQFSITGRQLLQNFGTEAHRDVFGQDFWVDALLPRGVVDDGGFKLMSNSNPDITADPADMKWVANFCDDFVRWPNIAVITDVRFENECHRIHELGGQVWRINRVDLPRGDTHASEAVLDDELIDREVENGYGVEVYRELVAALAKAYIIPEARKEVPTQ